MLKGFLELGKRDIRLKKMHVWHTHVHFSDKTKTEQEVHSHNCCGITGCNSPLDISGMGVRKAINMAWCWDNFRFLMRWSLTGLEVSGWLWIIYRILIRVCTGESQCTWLDPLYTLLRTKLLPVSLAHRCNHLCLHLNSQNKPVIRQKKKQ